MLPEAWQRGRGREERCEPEGRTSLREEQAPRPAGPALAQAATRPWRQLGGEGAEGTPAPRDTPRAGCLRPCCSGDPHPSSPSAASPRRGAKGPGDAAAAIAAIRQRDVRQRRAQTTCRGRKGQEAAGRQQAAGWTLAIASGLTKHDHTAQPNAQSQAGCMNTPTAGGHKALF